MFMISYHVTGKTQDISPDWWGHKFGFVAGGMLGAKSRNKKSLERCMFNEDDQENLYNLAQVCCYAFI